jgi:outer membrane protein OmpA-like peptidoglycan-associated protein/flagellar hook assembly protein FlgD
MKRTVLVSLLLGASVLALVAADGPEAPSTHSDVYFSPNNDGVKDTFKIPFVISDRRYISQWQLEITDESGHTVRTISNKISHPVSLSFKEFWKTILTPKKSVDIPPFIVWDGVMDSGEVAPDGRYFYEITAADDNGNTSGSPKKSLILDNTPPEIELSQPAATDKFFGEGAKSTLRIRQSGSDEDLWRASVSDTAGREVRSWSFTGAEPKDLIWDGRDDAGIHVPDGVYAYAIGSTDRAGNVSAPAKITNIVYSGDKPITNIAISGSRYFSPGAAAPSGGAGQDRRIKTITLIPTIPAPSSGNSLQGWAVRIVDMSGSVRKSFTGGGAVPASITFDGSDDGGAALPDGSYQARLSATYLNGYTTPDKLSPVIMLDRISPEAAIGLAETIFSPDGNGDKDTIVFEQRLSAEQTPWRGEIVNSQGQVVRGFDLGGSPPSSLVWNGLNDSGTLCPDGLYSYRVTDTDLAGNTGIGTSEPFTLDTSATELVISLTPDAFSPNGDGVQDSVRFSLSSKSESGIARYQFDIAPTSAPLKIVRSFTGTDALPPSIVWDGRTNDGLPSADGQYQGVLKATARNGAASSVTTSRFTLDTTPPQIEISAPYTLFSPDGDSKKETLPLAITSSGEKRWVGTITPEGGREPVKNFVWYDGSVPSFAWDGTDDSGNIVKDGAYRLTLTSRDEAGNTGTADLAGITVDTRPVRGWVSALHETIAPNGNNTKSQTFNIEVSPKDGIESWGFTVVNTENPEFGPVAAWGGLGDTIPASIDWDGKQRDGMVAEGVFNGQLNVTYRKGNTINTDSAFFYSTGRPPQISVETRPLYFSPDNDGVDDDEFINLRAFSYLPFASWNFEVFEPGGKTSFWTAGGKSKITEQLVWNGKSNSGELVQSAMDYPYTFTVTDIEGQTSAIGGMIRVDVLVIVDGDKLKMQVPAIIFRADHADFVSKAEDPQQGLDQTVIDNNMRVLRRLAEILKKFKDYSIVIEGHGHNISGTEEEETSTARGNIPLIPLSKDRAEFVKVQLVKLGIAANRMKTEGVGGRKPVANRDKRDDWWKDRRVEFILNKTK